MTANSGGMVRLLRIPRMEEIRTIGECRWCRAMSMEGQSPLDFAYYSCRRSSRLATHSKHQLRRLSHAQIFVITAFAFTQPACHSVISRDGDMVITVAISTSKPR